MVHDGCIFLEEHVLPVGVVRGNFVQVERFFLPSISGALVHEHAVFVGIQHIQFFGCILYAIIARIGHVHFPFRPFLCGDQHHAVGCPRPVNGGRSGIFQHIYRFYVAGVEVVDTTNCHTINDVEGISIPGCSGTPDAHSRGLTGLPGELGHLHTGSPALHGLFSPQHG